MIRFAVESCCLLLFFSFVGEIGVHNLLESTERCAVGMRKFRPKQLNEVCFRVSGIRIFSLLFFTEPAGKLSYHFSVLCLSRFLMLLDCNARNHVKAPTVLQLSSPQVRWKRMLTYMAPPTRIWHITPHDDEQSSHDLFELLPFHRSRTVSFSSWDRSLVPNVWNNEQRS